MKRLITYSSCIAFAIGGFFISVANNSPLYTKTAYAAQAPVIMQYPKDLLLDHTNNVGLKVVRDTIHDTIPLKVLRDTITVTKYKTKWKVKTEFIPDTISSRASPEVDTIYVSKPVLIIPIEK